MLPPESQPWGAAMKQLIDETEAAIPSIEGDLSARFKGLNATSTALGQQTGKLSDGLSAIQPTRMGFASATGFTLKFEDNGGFLLTATLPVPNGYTGAMVQAQGFGYAVETNNLTKVDMSGRIEVNGVAGPLTISPVQAVNGNEWHYELRNVHGTIAGVGATLTVGLRLFHRGYREFADARNAAHLAVMATFYKGALLPPA